MVVCMTLGGLCRGGLGSPLTVIAPQGLVQETRRGWSCRKVGIRFGPRWLRIDLSLGPLHALGFGLGLLLQQDCGGACLDGLLVLGFGHQLGALCFVLLPRLLDRLVAHMGLGLHGQPPLSLNR